MKSTNNILIEKLRLLPRHGRQDRRELDPEADSDARERNIKKRREEIAENISATNVLKELSNTLEKARVDADKFENVLASVSKATTGLRTKFVELSMGLGKTMKFVDDYNKKILQTVKNSTYLEERNKELNKSYGLSSKGANKFSKELRNVAIRTGIGGDKAFKYAEGLKDLTGGFMTSTKANEDFNAELIMGQSYLQNNMGLSEDAALRYEQYAASIGKSGVEAAHAQQELASALSAQTGMDATQIQKDILEGIAETSEEIVGQYSKMPGNLEVAVMKAKALGTSMDQLHQTGQGLLEIESSVGKELEYQQLTGKRLLDSQGKSLTNEYRMATIRGDGARQAELMSEFLEEEGDNLENNMFARKKAAELFGMQEGDMMRMKRQRDILAKMGAEDLLDLEAGDVEEIAKKLRAEGASKDDVETFLKESDTRTTAERSSDYLKSIDEKLVSDVQARFGDKEMDMLRQDTETFVRNQNETKENIAKMTETFGEIAVLEETIKTAITPIAAVGKNLPIFGTAMTKLVEKLKGRSFNLVTEGTPAEDVISYPGAGARVLTGPFGAFQLDPRDFIMAGDPNNMVAPSGADPTALVAMMVKAISGLTVQAKISPDMFMQASELNDARNLS